MESGGKERDKLLNETVDCTRDIFYLILVLVFNLNSRESPGRISQIHIGSKMGGISPIFPSQFCPARLLSTINALASITRTFLYFEKCCDACVKGGRDLHIIIITYDIIRYTYSYRRIHTEETRIRNYGI